MYFHKIKNPPFGYPIVLSELQLPQRRRRPRPPLPPGWMVPSTTITPPPEAEEENQVPDEDLVDGMQQLHLNSPNPMFFQQVASLHTATLPTFGQIKKLTTDAREVVAISGEPITPVTLFLAMIALLSLQVPYAQAQKSYWAYVPNPPYSI